MLIGFLLGFALAFALVRVERGSTPSPRLHARPGPRRATSPAPRTGALPSNVRRVPRWESDYAARYLDECREVGQDEVLRRRAQ